MLLLAKLTTKGEWCHGQSWRWDKNGTRDAINNGLNHTAAQGAVLKHDKPLVEANIFSFFCARENFVLKKRNTFASFIRSGTL